MPRKKPKPTPPPAVNVPPTCSCLLLCDDVVISHAHDKHMLQGVIGAIAVPALPSKLGGFVVYMRLSNVHAQQNVIVKFEHAASGDVLWELAAIVIQQDPLQVNTLVTRVPAFDISKDGRYMVTAYHGSEILAQIPVIVHNQGAQKEDEP